MITLNQSVEHLQRQLNDEEGEIWSHEQLRNWLQHGYETLCRDTLCLFDMVMYDTQPYTGNYTKEFEKDFMYGMPIFGRFDITRPSEADEMEGSPVVANNTRLADAAPFMLPDIVPTTNTTRRLPAGIVAVDRVTHHWLRLAPEQDRYHRKTRINYQTLEGGVFSYQQDQDGWQTIRLVNVPVPVIQSEDISGVFGVARQMGTDSMDQEVIIGSYGGMRSVPRHFNSGQYGVIRRIISDDYHTRVELFRLGKELDHEPYEIPDRFVKYVEWWALYRAYGTPGQGENTKLSDHYLSRYKNGVEVVKKRVQTVLRERTIAMGSKRVTTRDGYLQHFPANMGYARPFGRG